MNATLSTFLSVLAVSLVSLVGISLLALGEKLVKRMLTVLISFAVGALLGDVFMHILPEMAEGGTESFTTGSLVIALGILLSFLIEKTIHWQHNHSLDCHEHVHPVGMVAIVGDAAHNIVDGILIAGSFLVDVPTGIATTVAVVLHEIPQEISDFAILLHSGYSRSRAIFLNVMTAFTAFAGAALVLLLQSSMPDIERYIFPLVAGNFLYIAVADLIPELHKHPQIRQTIGQVAAVLAGGALMYGLTFLE